jgi:hypothetical protein
MLDQHDVREMQVAMTTPHISLPATFQQLCFCQMINGLTLLEAGHFNREFDRRSPSVDTQ